MIQTIRHDFNRFESYDVSAMQHVVGKHVLVKRFGVSFGASADFTVEHAVANLIAHGLMATQVDQTTFIAHAVDERNYTVSLDLVAPELAPSTSMDVDSSLLSKKRKLVTQVNIVLILKNIVLSFEPFFIYFIFCKLQNHRISTKLRLKKRSIHVVKHLVQSTWVVASRNRIE